MVFTLEVDMFLSPTLSTVMKENIYINVIGLNICLSLNVPFPQSPVTAGHLYPTKMFSRACFWAKTGLVVGNV